MGLMTHSGLEGEGEKEKMSVFYMEDGRLGGRRRISKISELGLGLCYKKGVGKGERG
jgi:hypothetical protein